MKRVLKFFGLTLLLLVLLLAGGLSWIIGSQSGTRQALSLAQRFAPGTLKWDEADGRLAGPLRLRGLHYSQEDGIEASLDELNFDWRPSALFGLDLVVDQLHLDGVEVHLAEATEEAEPPENPSSGELPNISLPVSVSLDDIAVNSIALYPAGQDTAIEIDRVALSGTVVESDVTLNYLDVIAPQGELRLKGTVATTDDYPMNLALDWQADIGQSSPLQGEGTFAGSLAALQIEHQLSGFAVADVAASVTDVIQSPAWDASIEASLSDPESLSKLLSGTPEITLQTSGTPDDYQAQATVEVTTAETGPVTVNADVGGSTQQLNIGSLIVRMHDNGGELSAKGQLRFDTLEGDIQGQWQNMGWPLEGEPQFSSAEGSFDVQGSADEFSANLVTGVGGELIPDGQWTVSLQGSATELGNFTVQGQTLDGTITASGTAGWEEQPEWDVELVTEGVNPGSQWPDFPGSINVQVSSEGQISEDGPQLTADITQLSGRFRQQPLSGSGRVQLQGEQLNIDGLELNHGPSSLTANGKIEDQLALDFEIDSTDLGSLLPDLEGAVSLIGTVSGSKDAPTLKASGSADNVAFAGNSVGKLNLSVEAGLAADAISDVSVSASDIMAGGQNISDINLNGQGSQADHRLEVSAKTDQGNLATQLEGSYQETTWTGSLASLELEDSLAGDWRLREPVAITANAQKADASELCLDNGDQLGSLCVTGSWLAEGESQVIATISGLSPELAAAYLPEGFQVETELNGDVTALLGSDGDVNAQASLVLTPGKLTLESGASPVEIGLEQTTVDASWRGNEGTLDLASAFTDFGDLEVQASISDPAGVGRLAGQLDLDFADLTLISAFAPQIQEVTGTLRSNLKLGGTLQEPALEGELALQDFSAEIPETAMLIEDTQLTVTGNPDGTLIIKGQSRSGDGQLNIDGSINPGTQALNMSIVGDSYEVANTAMMQALVSPELDIAMDSTGMQVKGTVTIPSAYINANGGNEGIDTVSASSDVIYVSEEGEQAESPPSQLSLDVQIILGDSIEVEAGDFRGRLAGDLRVEQTPELAPRGTGTINVLNGDYVIYGQQLNMERGTILFSGGPVENPSLDMEVAREVQEYDVVAGARIRGTAQAPILELYSEPSMPDASILSFILLGQPAGTTGGSYTLGKYLTPDLYVSYGIGLFDAINTFNMRYSLTDKLAVEAESGTGSSADLIYTIEK